MFKLKYRAVHSKSARAVVCLSFFSMLIRSVRVSIGPIIKEITFSFLHFTHSVFANAPMRTHSDLPSMKKCPVSKQQQQKAMVMNKSRKR